MTIGWDDPRTADFYEAFCRSHDRYRAANEALVANAALEADHRVLDLAAGIGGTAAAVLPRLGKGGRVVCVEPAAAMRERGESRIHDPRVEWTAGPPEGMFDRVLVGAAIWQMTPLDRTLGALAALLRVGGALVFDIPAAYLGVPDGPGGGDDPHLTTLPGLLVEGRSLPAAEPLDLPDVDGVEAMLVDAGLEPKRWEFRRRMTQAEYRDWLKIPPISDRMLDGVDPDDRAARIDAAFERMDASSWRWERWVGFTAWRSR